MHTKAKSCHSISADFGLEFTNVATHAVNSAYVVLDIFITGLPHRILHFWTCLLFGVAYAAFTVIYFAAGAAPVYPGNVDFEEEPFSSAGFLIIAITVTVVIHCLLFFLYWLRVLCCNCCGCSKSFDSELNEADDVTDDAISFDQIGLDNPAKQDQYITSIEMYD